ncbi:thioredoxin domain-containing protein [Sphingomonas flavalba]|uniref:thioredoxin domain-containing protein n=1 Tax=Sphingomonas flavalba TaxID=2559804 RepID=UPI0039DF532C
MKSTFAIAAAAAVLTLAGCQDKATENAAEGNAVASAPAVPPPAGTEWVSTVTKTADGGFLIGNPNAKVKLVEYLSMTCPHCAEFGQTAFPPLRDKYIQKGTVSLEVRNYVRDPIDVTASLIARCNGAEPFLPLTEQLFGYQNAMFDRAQKLTQADQQRIGALPQDQQFGALAPLIGLDEFARQHGISDAKLKTCLSDKGALDELVAIQKKANEELKILGTPTFFINDKMLEATGTWESLEPQLIAAGA